MTEVFTVILIFVFMTNKGTCTDGRLRRALMELEEVVNN